MFSLAPCLRPIRRNSVGLGTRFSCGWEIFLDILFPSLIDVYVRSLHDCFSPSDEQAARQVLRTLESTNFAEGQICIFGITKHGQAHSFAGKLPLFIHRIVSLRVPYRLVLHRGRDAGKEGMTPHWLGAEHHRLMNPYSFAGLFPIFHNRKLANETP